MDDDYPYEPERDYQRDNPAEDEPPPPKMGFEGKASAAQAGIGDDLWELHSAATHIAEFTSGRTLTDFETQEVLRAAIEQMLLLMDAAAARIARQSPELAARLPHTDDLHTLLDAETPDRETALWRFVTGPFPDLLLAAANELAAWHEG